MLTPQAKPPPALSDWKANLTVMVAVPLTPSTMAVIVAVPGETPDMVCCINGSIVSPKPIATTRSSLLDQITSLGKYNWLSPAASLIVATRVSPRPMATVALGGLISTDSSADGNGGGAA